MDTTRRGFMGWLGAVGLGAAVAITGKKDEPEPKPEPPKDEIKLREGLTPGTHGPIEQHTISTVTTYVWSYSLSNAYITTPPWWRER